MDSFEYYGELMNQWDSASPPGDIHRRTFDKSLMGMEMRGGGGGKSDSERANEKAAERSHEYNTDVYNHQNKIGRENVAYALETVRLQRENQEQQLSFQEETRERDWERQSYIIDETNKANTTAYEKSNRIADSQLGLNTEAAVGSIKAANNRYKERLFGLDIDKKKTELDQDISRQGLNSFRKEAAFKGQTNFLEGLQLMGEVSVNTGRSAVKKKISAISSAAFKSAELSDQITSEESKNNLELLGFDIDRVAHHGTGLSIQKAYKSDVDKIALSLKQANLATDMRRLAKPWMQPPIEKPDLLPRTEFQDPKPWRDGVHPRYMAPYQATGSGGGGGGGSVGSVLGLASSAATTLGAFGSMAATGGGAIGLGGMGSIGLGMMGPIGLGLGVVAAAGSAFDWW